MKSKFYVRYSNTLELGDFKKETILIKEFESPQLTVDFLKMFLTGWSTQKDFDKFNIVYGNREDYRLFFVKLNKNWRCKVFPFGRMLTTWECDNYFDLRSEIDKKFEAQVSKAGYVRAVVLEPVLKEFTINLESG